MKLPNRPNIFYYKEEKPKKPSILGFDSNLQGGYLFCKFDCLSRVLAFLLLKTRTGVLQMLDSPPMGECITASEAFR
jgi:hypothetical protein